MFWAAGPVPLGTAWALAALALSSKAKTPEMECFQFIVLLFLLRSRSGQSRETLGDDDFEGFLDRKLGAIGLFIDPLELFVRRFVFLTFVPHVQLRVGGVTRDALKHGLRRHSCPDTPVNGSHGCIGISRHFGREPEYKNTGDERGGDGERQVEQVR